MRRERKRRRGVSESKVRERESRRDVVYEQEEETEESKVHTLLSFRISVKTEGKPTSPRHQPFFRLVISTSLQRNGLLGDHTGAGGTATATRTTVSIPTSLTGFG